MTPGARGTATEEEEGVVAPDKLSEKLTEQLTRLTEKDDPQYNDFGESFRLSRK